MILIKESPEQVYESKEVFEEHQDEMEEYSEAATLPCYETSPNKEPDQKILIVSEGEEEPLVELNKSDNMEKVTSGIEEAKQNKDKQALRTLRAKERLLLMKEIDYLKNKEASNLMKARSENVSAERLDEKPKRKGKPGRLDSIPESVQEASVLIPSDLSSISIDKQDGRLSMADLREKDSEDLDK